MDNLLDEKKEALEVAGEYLEKLIPGIGTLCGELRGDRQPDTDEFQKQCIDGLNWVIEIYNRVTDVVDAEKIHTGKVRKRNGLFVERQLMAAGGSFLPEDDR